MAERRFAATPVGGVVVGHLRALEGDEGPAEVVPEEVDVEGFRRRMGGGGVDGHVVDAVVELAEGGEGVVDVFCFDEAGDEVVGESGWGRGGGVVEGERGGAGGSFLRGLPGGEVGGGEGRVVLREGFELRGRPAPVFEHLRRRFDEVLHHGGAVETGEFCYGDEVVDAVAEFWEGLLGERFDLGATVRNERSRVGG